MSGTIHSTNHRPDSVFEAKRGRAVTLIDLVATLAIIAGFTLCVPGLRGAEPSSATGRQPRVLVLYSNERLLPANIAADEAIRTTFESELKVPVEFYTEFLDVDRFPGADQQERTQEFLSDKYRERPPDVIIAGGTSALNFLIRHRATLFPRVPVVHCGVSPGRMPESFPDDLIVGLPYSVDLLSTLKLALQLQPDTLRVAMIGGGGLEQADIASLGTKVEFLSLTNRSIAKLREDLANLPDQTVVFYGAMFRDSAGNAFTPRAALEQFAPASRVPIYGHYSTYLGHGVVGGSTITYETVGSSAARTAIRILRGQKPQDAVRGAAHTPTPMVDWQQLRRWKLDENRLPAGSVILFRPPTLWDQHRRLVILGLCVLIAQATTIAVLLLHRTRRRRAEAAALDLGGRLIGAQEVERRRLANELHDDLSQSLALLSVELDMFGQNPPDGRADISRQMQNFSSEVKDLSSDVHRLSHELHPAKLEQLGLAAAVRGFCKELATAHEIAIAFQSETMPADLSKDVALCLYRVTQEALQNMIKHSGAIGAKIELKAGKGELLLLVSDDGRGFDPLSSRRNGSLGLVSMHERVRMVGGRISIRSKPGEGTLVEVRVPITTEPFGKEA